MSVYFYRMRVVIMLAFAILLSAGLDMIGNLLLGRKKPEKYDFSAVVTAVIFTLMLPASAPYWMIGVGISLAVLVAKIPFGGFEKNIFNPAAFAAAFMVISWPKYMVQYPAVFADIGLESATDVSTTTSADYILQMGGAPKITFTDALLGNFPGPMGTTCIMVMCACALYLLVRGTMSWQLPFGAFSMVLLFALDFSAGLLPGGWRPLCMNCFRCFIFRNYLYGVGSDYYTKNRRGKVAFRYFAGTYHYVVPPFRKSRM